MQLLMSPEYSPAGSSRRELEETLMDDFQDFLMALDDGNITGYESAVAWNYNENDLDIPEAVAEPLIEKFETADLTSAGITGRLLLANRPEAPAVEWRKHQNYRKV